MRNKIKSLIVVLILFELILGQFDLPVLSDNIVTDYTNAVDVYYTFDGAVTNGKFGIGEITAYCSVGDYRSPNLPVLIIAQYENNILINVSCGNNDYTDGIIVTKLYTKKSQGTIVKIMAFDSLENGRPLCKTITLEPYSNEEINQLYNEIGDFSFFNSNYITHRYTGYPNTKFYPKTNEIICEKFDHYNVNKGDKIILKKTTTDDCYFDITTKVFDTYLSNKVYQYFKIAADVSCDFTGEANVHCFLLRDTQSAAGQINIVTTAINTDGSLTLLGGNVISNVASNGKWFNLTVYINLLTHKMDIYVNGERKAKNVAFTNQFNSLDLVRVIYRHGEGAGEVRIRNMEVTGLSKPFEGMEVKTSMFPSDDNLRDYLADKIGFHLYGESIYSNGEKRRMTKTPLYFNDELYISKEDWNTTFGIEAEFEQNLMKFNGNMIFLAKGTKNHENTVFVPVKEIAEKALGKFVFDDTNGMILVSDHHINLDLTNEVAYHRRKHNIGYIDQLSFIQNLNDFLLFERPSREYLLESFNQITDSGAMHPRILATREDFEKIKQESETDGDLRNIVDNLISQADEAVKSSPISYRFQDNLRLTDVAERLRTRMIRLGFAYQITGNKKYVDAAWENLSVLSTFPDINPGHPIDAGSFMAGMAIGYDWMYHGFTEEQRRIIADNAIRLGITVMNNGFYGRTPARGGPDGNINVVGLYNKWISNYNIWVNHGTMLAALAFMENEPILCTDLLWHSLRSMEYGLKNFSPDGAWIESSNYWKIAAGFLAYSVMSLEKIFGTDFNLTKFPGVSRTGIFMQTLRSPIASYNYHDAAEESEFAGYPMMFYGTYFNQPELLAARKMTLTRALNGMASVKPDIFDALLYRPDVNVNDITKLPRVSVARGLESFAVHQNYLDFNGLFFASHAGPVTAYHSQNDNGDFVFDLLGERWACALPAEDYNSSLTNSEKYRYRTEGHNTVTINNTLTLNQKAHTYAPMIKWEESNGGAFCVYDMSEMYTDVHSYLRGFYIGGNYTTLTIRDEIQLKKQSEVYWFMHTTAEAVVTGEKSVLLTKNGKSIMLAFETNAPVSSLSIMDAVPLPSSPKGEGQNPNTGYRKVAIRLEGSGQMDLTVKLSANEEDVDVTPISEWVAPE